MSDAYTAYQQAYKEGIQNVNERKEKGLDPYLPNLDEFLEFSTVLKESPAQTREIFTDLIVGTKTESRSNSFSHNFMPLLSAESEFAAKWISLYASQSEVGITDPILVYEVYGRYFVQEGNKRVSVSRFLKAPNILADVRHMEIEVPNTFQGKLYKEFCNFQKETGLNSVFASTPDIYQRLLLQIKDQQETSEERMDLVRSLYKTFWSLYPTLEIRNPLQIGDAFLIYLETFGLPRKAKSRSQLESELNSILPRLSASNENEQNIKSGTNTTDRSSLFSLFGAPLKIAFINAGDEKSPAWTREHLEAVRKLSDFFEDHTDLSVYNHVNTPEELEKALDKAVADRNFLIFTTHPYMLQMTNRYAALYPQVKFLNSSINPESSAIRSYYARSYEGLFLLGVLAGIYTETGQIGYIADYPIYGEAAKINAFALGVMMTCPHATIYLDWSTTKKATLETTPRDIDFVYIAGREFDLEPGEPINSGLFDIRPGQYKRIGWLETDWAVFYSVIIRSVLNHSYKSDGDSKEPVSYWWGLSNDLLKMHYSSSLNAQSLRLVNQLEKDLKEKRLYLFTDEIPQLASLPMENGHLSLARLASMDWLFENVVGTLPALSEFEQASRSLAAVHGLGKLRKSS